MSTTIVDYSIRMRMGLDKFEAACSLFLEDIVRPAKTFLLTTSMETQRKRLQGRNCGIDTHTDTLVLSSDAYVNDTLERYMALAQREGWPIIDTTELTPIEVAREVIRQIERQ